MIDWPPYYRPVGFALAVAAGDAVRWEDVPVEFLDDWADVPDWYQLVARALVYRLATAGVQQRNGMSVADLGRARRRRRTGRPARPRTPQLLSTTARPWPTPMQMAASP